MVTDKKQKILKNTLLFCGSILITLFLAELLVRLVIPQDKKVLWLEMHPDGFMMNQSGGTAFQEFKDQKTDYRFGSTRTRGAEPESPNPKVLTIGDSFTFGLLLNEEDTYVSLLDDEFENISFVNGGIGGSGLADWPGWLEQYGEAISPEYLILFLNYDDIERALSKNLYVLSPKDSSLIKSQRWRPNEFMFSLNKTGWYRWLQTHSDLANLTIKVLWKYLYFEDVTHNFNPSKTSVPIPELSDLGLDSMYSLELARQLTQRIAQWCGQNDCTFILATTGYFSPDNESPHTYRFYQWLKEHHDELDHPFFDIKDCVDASANGDINTLKIPDDGHPNEEGAEAIARCTSSWFKSFLSDSNTDTVTN